MKLKTSNGIINFRKDYPSIHQRIDRKKAIQNIQILQLYLDKAGIEWGPAFGTLVGIVL